MQLTCIIVEDEPLAMEKAASFVSQVRYLNLVGTFHNALDAMVFLKERPVDLIFLDIEMDGLNGIQLIEALSNVPQVIIMTAYEKYALKGYELQIADYLMKPFTLERFVRAVDKVYETLKPGKGTAKDYFFIKTEYRAEKIMFGDVLYIEGMSDYRDIKLLNRHIMTLQTFNELEQLLPTEKICRVHKSYMVALDKVEFVERNRIRIKDKLIPLSDSYRDLFFTLTGIDKK